VSLPGDVPAHIGLFSESASRAVISVAPERATELEDTAEAMHVPFFRLGETGGPRIVFDGLFEMNLAQIAEHYEGAIPELLAG
jgi:phosphoribosylformylglycinamidine synthase